MAERRWPGHDNRIGDAAEKSAKELHRFRVVDASTILRWIAYLREQHGTADKPRILAPPVTFTRSREVRPYAAMAFILYQRHFPRNAIFCRLSDADAAAAEFFDAGVLSGCSLAAGYSIGVFGRWLWVYIELPQPEGRLLRVAKLAAATGCAVVAVIFLWQAARWQNSIRELMELAPVDTAHPLEVALIALAVFAILIALARLFQLTLRRGDKS